MAKMTYTKYFIILTQTITNLNAYAVCFFTVCSEYNHVRSWSVTRFRGMISTQPGSQPLASFKVLSLEESHPIVHTSVGNNVGMSVVDFHLM